MKLYCEMMEFEIVRKMCVTWSWHVYISICVGDVLYLRKYSYLFALAVPFERGKHGLKHKQKSTHCSTLIVKCSNTYSISGFDWLD